MQEQNKITGNGTAENAVPLAASDAAEIPATVYVVDADTFYQSIETTNEDDSYVIQHGFKRADLTSLITREHNKIHQNETRARGRLRLHVDDEVANEAYHDQNCITATVHKVDSKDAPTILSVEQIREFTREHKAEAVRRYLECKAKIISKGNGFDFLFEREGELRGELRIGDADALVCTIPFVIRSPEKSKRAKFNKEFSTTDLIQSGDKPLWKTETDLRVAVRLFDEYFESVSNVFIGGHLYTAADKEQFIALFNPFYKVEIAAATVDHFELKK